MASIVWALNQFMVVNSFYLHFRWHSGRLGEKNPAARYHQIDSLAHSNFDLRAFSLNPLSFFVEHSISE